MHQSYKLHQGTFAFLNRLGFNIHQMRHVLREYARDELDIPLKKRSKGSMKNHTVSLSEKVQEDFRSFRNYALNYKKKYKIKRKQSYEEWWQECNMDGTFAYNGVTDDF